MFLNSLVIAYTCQLTTAVYQKFQNVVNDISSGDEDNRNIFMKDKHDALSGLLHFGVGDE